MTVRAVAHKIGVHEASVRRHKLNHRRRGLVRTVMLDVELEAYDFVDSLAVAYLDAERIRSDSIRRATSAGNATALRAMRAEIQLATQMFGTLGIDAKAFATRSRDQEHLADAVIRLLRRRPELAADLAEEVRDDPGMAGELRQIASGAHGPTDADRPVSSRPSRAHPTGVTCEPAPGMARPS